MGIERISATLEETNPGVILKLPNDAAKALRDFIGSTKYHDIKSFFTDNGLNKDDAGVAASHILLVYTRLDNALAF